MGKAKHLSTKKNNNKIIPMALDADFFFERVLRHLDRNNYSKALKYLWRIVDVEPNVPIHYCNLAGLLSEMGRFSESNELLLHVVEKLDPSLTECYYFLANNYAYLDEPESSFKYIHRYLDANPQGEYVEEALEMLTYISPEVDSIEEATDENEREQFILHYKAKALLEEGKFYDATTKLKSMVENYPDFLAARNNLALAYFYQGNHLKAIEQANLVLDKDQANIHALCNLAIFYQNLSYTAEMNNILAMLRKILPFQREHLYKLATTFAILGDHRMAYQHLNQLIRNGEILNSTLLHYGAVAAFNTGNYLVAEKWWEQIPKIDSDSEIARFYLDTTRDLKETGFVLPVYAYQYELPFEQIVNSLKHNRKQEKNAFNFTAFTWGLKNGKDTIKEQALLGLAFFDEAQAELTLRDFLLDEDNSFLLKKKALIALNEMQATPPYTVSTNGKTFQMERQIPDFGIWKHSWLEVLQLIEDKIGAKYSIIELYDAKILWYDFLSETYPQTPQVRKAAGWAAAIEYLVGKMHEKPMQISRLAKKYDCTKQTILKNIRHLEEVLQLTKKLGKLINPIDFDFPNP